MKNVWKNSFQKRAGITLIALVVTIVVLLILAGITINLVLGDNGIIKTAQRAGDKKNKAVEDELAQLEGLNTIFEKYENGGSERITKRFLQAILERKISEIDLNQNLVLRKTEKTGKLGILDVVAKINGTENCNIEIQLVDQKNIVERILYY